MGRTFKGGANIFQFVEGASIEILEATRTHTSYEAIFEAFSPSSEPPDCVLARREEVLRFLSLQDREVLLPLDLGSRRILALADRRGQQALAQVVDQALPEDLREAYDRQPDALCRAAWLHIAAP